MHFPSKPFKSTAFIVALALCLGAAVGAGAVMLTHGSPSSARASEAPTPPALASVTATDTLQALMSGVDAPPPPIAQDTTAEVVAGPPGADGIDGVDGAPGADGADGPEGPEGPRGAKGSVGATGTAGIGLTPVGYDGGGYEIRSPDGNSYRIHVTNFGIVFQGPSSTQIWNDASHFQTLVP